MAVVKNLMVRAGADFSAITKQANKASRSMRGMQQSVSRSCNMMTKDASGLKGILGAVGVALSLHAIASAAKDAAAAFDKQVEGEMKLAKVMRKTMGASNGQIQSILDLVSAQQELGIVGDEAQLAGAQQLAGFLKTTDALKTLIPLMNDMAVKAAGFNATEETAASVATSLGKAMNGQVTALQRMGYVFSDAQKQIMQYGTEADKAAVLTEVVGARVGGMNAALAATPTGRMMQLSNALGDIKEQFGQAVRTVSTVFLPILNTVGRMLAGIASMANKVAQTIANVFGGSVAGKEWEWAGISGEVSDAAGAMDDLTASTKKGTKAVKEQQKALHTLGFDTLNILGEQASAGSSGGGSGGSSGGTAASGSAIRETQGAASAAGDSIGWLQEKLEKLKAVWEDFKSKIDFDRLKEAWGSLKEAVGNFASTVGSVLGAVWDKYLKPLALWTINKALPVTLEAVAKVVEWLSEKLGNLGKLIRGEISFKEWLKTLGPLEIILGAVAVAILAVTGTVKLFSGALSGISTVVTIAGAAISALSTPFGAIIAIIAGVIAIVVLLIKYWDDLAAGASRLKTRVLQDLSDMKAGIIDSLHMVSANIKDRMKEIKDNFLGGVEKLRAGVVQKFEAVRAAVERVITKIRNLMTFDWQLPHLKTPHLDWSTKPADGWMADILSALGLPTYLPDMRVSWYGRGGVFDRPSLIGVGDAGKEAVVPLEHNTGWISKVAGEIASQLSGGAGGLSGADLIAGIHDAVYQAMVSALGTRQQSRGGAVVIEINGREFYRATYKDLQAVSKERGIALIKT